MKIRQFMQKNYKHFNAATCVDAAEGWVKLVESGGKMIVTLAGAMSTAELGISLARMIREGKVAAIACTGANLEEDLFNLVANSRYWRFPDYRAIPKEKEMELYENDFHRVTDTCIPRKEIEKMDDFLKPLWEKADRKKERYFPHEYLYQLIRSGELEPLFDIDPKNSWLLAACEANLPLFVPGWEDSSLGNLFVSHKCMGRISSFSIMKSGLEYFEELIHWYKKSSMNHKMGFFQIGGGIAGDFTICVVPAIRRDLMESQYPLLSYFCQISDSTTSYGSYSGAAPNEKITWGKLGVDTESYLIESDATIVAPLIFSYVLGD